MLGTQFAGQSTQFVWKNTNTQLWKFFHFQLTTFSGFVFFFILGLLVNLAVKRATRLLNSFTK